MGSLQLSLRSTRVSAGLPVFVEASTVFPGLPEVFTGSLTPRSAEIYTQTSRYLLPDVSTGSFRQSFEVYVISGELDLLEEVEKSKRYTLSVSLLLFVSR